MSESFFGVAWWNVNNYFHFEPEKLKRDVGHRWPRSLREYRVKSSRVDVALKELFKLMGTPKILGLGEITGRAAHELRDRILPAYRVLSCDTQSDVPAGQVAILYAPDAEGVLFHPQDPLLVPYMPRSTRPMIILDVRIRDHVVRIVACHWQSKMGEDNADETRNRLAHALSIQNYNFVNEDIEKHHLVIIGDFNAEPYERSLKTLHAHRDRARSKGVAHWTDGDVKRLHLYNTSWRLLGEQYPHPQHRARHSAMGDCAGTYYWEGGKAWRHFDQLIVSGGLLGDQLPHIDENETVIVSSEAFVADGLPVKFSRDGKRYIGLSDHLPIYANVHI